jgi:TolA-binding protein
MRSLSSKISLALMFALSTGTPVALAAGDDAGKGVKLRDQYTSEDASYAEMAAQKRLQSIDFLKELLSRGTAEGDQKAEMMLRLADLFFQQGRYYYLTEMAAFDVVFEQCFNTEECSTETLQPDNAQSYDWQHKSIRLYKQILQNYPRYTRADEATFYLGSALQDIGDRKEAIEYFTSLVKKYPDSVWVPDAYVFIGEYYFDENNAFKALLAFQKASAFPNSDMYGYSLYKLGWCQYNVGEYDTAIDTMKSVVAYSMAAATGDSKVQLEDEALKDLVRFFADSGELDEAYEYFNKLGKKNLIRSMLKRLANMYYEQGKFDQCIQTYRRLISEAPQSVDNPDYQHEIAMAYHKIGKRQQALDEVNKLRKEYGKASAWSRANASEQDAIKAADRLIEKDLRKLAVDYHNQAKKYGRGRQATETYSLAESAYRMYLAEYPSNAHTYEINYSYGELLYKLKKFDKAFDQYMLVVKLDPKGQHSKFCAESSIFAADKMVKAEGGGKTIKAKPGDSKEPQALTQWEQNLVDACKQYANLYPEEKKVKNIIYRSAYLLYNKYRFDEAAEQFNAVIKMDPSSREAETASHLMLDAFLIKEDWPNLRKNAKFYYDQEGLGSKKFKGEVYDIYERSSFKIIEVNFAADEDNNKAADAFVAFYDEFPESDVAAQALNNASVYYHKVHKVAKAMDVRKILVENETFGDKTKYYYDQVSSLGFDYETVASFDNAAKYYERMYNLYPEERKKRTKAKDGEIVEFDQRAADAIYSAAVFRRASNNWEVGVTNYESFVGSFPSDSRVDDVLLTIAEIHKEQKDWSAAQNAYKAFYTDADAETPADFVYFARLQSARALEQLGQQDAATAVYKETVAMYEASIAAGVDMGTINEFIAEMMYKLAEPQFAAHMLLRLEGCDCTDQKKEDKAFAETLTAKGKSLAAVQNTYTAILNTGAGEWGLASLLKLGEAYENMSGTLLNSVKPFYLSDEQQGMYMMALEDSAYPQIEKAVQAYNAALNKSYEITLYNENTAFAARQLGVLRPDDFPGLEETLVKPRYFSTSTKSFDYDPSL